jgi:hypothetical protein
LNTLAVGVRYVPHTPARYKITKRLCDCQAKVRCDLQACSPTRSRAVRWERRRFLKLSPSELEETDRLYRPSDSVQSDCVQAQNRTQCLTTGFTGVIWFCTFDCVEVSGVANAPVQRRRDAVRCMPLFEAPLMPLPTLQKAPPPARGRSALPSPACLGGSHTCATRA